MTGCASLSRAALEEQGFVGWCTFSDLRPQLRTIDPAAGGIYVVYTDAVNPPEFLAHNPAGTFRGDPSVSVDALRANWVPGASVVYIGKANHGRLRDRLREFEGFGRGTQARHWGGRLIWQLRDSVELLVAWRVLPVEQSPKGAEDDALALFVSEHGAMPFANAPHLS